MTVEQILANNSKQEEITIIVSSTEQYEDFMLLLDTQKYRWANGKEVYGKNQWIPDCLKTENDYLFSAITLDSKRNIITYINFFHNGFDLEKFKDSASFLFGTNNLRHKPFASIYKPYLALKAEIEDYAEDYEL